MMQFLKQQIRKSPALFKLANSVAIPFVIQTEKKGPFSEDQNLEIYPTLINELKKMPHSPRGLEMGTKVRHERSTHNRGEFKDIEFSEYVLTDYEPGRDVDVVADAHKMEEVFGAESFDLVVSIAVFEHLKYPQIAAHELMKILKIGGVAYVDTHQTHHLHGYPSDYYRFSRRALKSLFPKEMGVDILIDYYQYPCHIYSHHSGIQMGESYTNVGIVIKKVAPTPNEFIYDFSHESY